MLVVVCMAVFFHCQSASLETLPAGIDARGYRLEQCTTVTDCNLAYAAGRADAQAGLVSSCLRVDV